MFSKIEHFRDAWDADAKATRITFAALTDESLKQYVADGHRTMGRIAWHITQTIPEMMSRTGLSPEGPSEKDPAPESAAEILRQYNHAAASLIEEVTKKWNDETLEKSDDLYGSQWKRGVTLRILIEHQVHHRGQMTVLMRQAGLKVPGAFGPSKEEWGNYGMPEPEI